MRYLIPESDAIQINEAYPNWWIFADEENVFDQSNVRFYDFDYESIFNDLYSKTLSEYLSDKTITDKPYAIYNYISNPTTPSYICPKDQPFNTLWWLKSKPHYINWRLDSVDRYGKDSDWEFTIICVKENYTYEVYFLDYVKTITNTITWFYEDWTEWDSIEDFTQLELWQASMLWKDTRMRVIEDLKPTLIWLLMQWWYSQEVASWMLFQIFWLYWSQVNSYIEWFKDPLIDAVTDDTSLPRLDQDINGITPRQLILSKIVFTV